MAVDSIASTAPRRAAFWNDPRYRAIFYQVLALAILVLFFLFIVDNTLTNLRSRGIASGFGFLGSTAGFGINQTLIPYTEESTYGRVFLVGVLNTLLVSFVGVIFATILGFLIGIARLSSNWLIAKLASVYIEIFRNIPLLLQILFWFTAVLASLPRARDGLEFAGGVFLNVRGLYLPRPVPESGFGFVFFVFLIGIAVTIALRRWAKKRQEATGEQFPVFRAGLGLIIGLPVVVFLIAGLPLSFEVAELRGFNFQGGLRVFPAFLALLLALVVYTAAFIAEVVRAGIQSVNKGQTEAANALGLRQGPTLRLVIIPQAMRVIIPPLTSQYLNLTKNSSLATAIAYQDLTAAFAGTVLNQTGQAVEIMGITMAVYLSISLFTSIVMNIYNARMALVER